MKKQLTTILCAAIVVLAVSCQKLLSDRYVLIGPLGDLDPAELDSIKLALAEEYKDEITVSKEINLPESALVKIKMPRYRADSLLIFLEELRKKEGANYVMGVTQVDISTTKRSRNGSVKAPSSTYIDWGIFGLGYRPGRASVISTYRLQQNSPHYYARIKKVAVHEFGHNLGLPHCVDTDTCVMRDAAERLQTIDQVGNELCYICKKKLNM
jgi:archaemetzincin